LGPTLMVSRSMLGARAGIPARLLSITYARGLIIPLNSTKTRPIAARNTSTSNHPYGRPRRPAGARPSGRHGGGRAPTAGGGGRRGGAGQGPPRGGNQAGRRRGAPILCARPAARGTRQANCAAPSRRAARPLTGGSARHRRVWRRCAGRRARAGAGAGGRGGQGARHGRAGELRRLQLGAAGDGGARGGRRPEGGGGGAGAAGRARRGGRAAARAWSRHRPSAGRAAPVRRRGGRGGDLA
jgi:translation initiation factor IF-2